MARINTHLGAGRRNRLTTDDFTRDSQPFFGSVPDWVKPPAAAPASHASASAGYHSDMSVPGYQPATPTAAPPAGEAAQGPAGHYSGARRAYTRSLAALPNPIATLSPPAAAAPTGRPSLLETLSPTLATLLAPAASGLALGALAEPAKPTGAVDPQDPLGGKTLGDATAEQLLEASRNGTLKIGAGGRLTTPEVRSAIGELKDAQQKFAATARPDLTGLSPEERALVPYVLRAHKEYPDVPVSVQMAQIKQESGFNPLAVSSAGAFGATQFIPSTAESYGVKPGDSPAAIQSQVTGQAHLLHDDNFSTDPQGALSAYSGGYAAADYNNPILADAKASYSALDKPTRVSPQVRAELHGAKQQAVDLGIDPNRGRTGRPTKPAVGGPGRIPSVVYIGEKAEKKFGLSVGENPAFGGVAPVHVSDSYHYRTDAKGRGEAIDVSGDASKMMAFDQWVAQKWGQGVTELFYDPGISIKEGTEIGAIGGHEDHVHVAVAQPGEHIGGGVTVGPSGAVFIGAGSTAAGAEASAERAKAAAGSGQGLSQSPIATALTPIASPLGAGPVTPQDVALGADEHVESAAENILALLGEGGALGRRPAL